MTSGPQQQGSEQEGQGDDRNPVDGVDTPAANEVEAADLEGATAPKPTEIGSDESLEEAAQRVGHEIKADLDEIVAADESAEEQTDTPVVAEAVASTEEEPADEPPELVEEEGIALIAEEPIEAESPAAEADGDFHLVFEEEVKEEEASSSAELPDIAPLVGAPAEVDEDLLPLEPLYESDVQDDTEREVAEEPGAKEKQPTEESESTEGRVNEASSEAEADHEELTAGGAESETAAEGGESEGLEAEQLEAEVDEVEGAGEPVGPEPAEDHEPTNESANEESSSAEEGGDVEDGAEGSSESAEETDEPKSGAETAAPESPEESAAEEGGTEEDSAESGDAADSGATSPDAKGESPEAGAEPGLGTETSTAPAVDIKSMLAKVNEIFDRDGRLAQLSKGHRGIEAAKLEEELLHIQSSVAELSDVVADATSMLPQHVVAKSQYAPKLFTEQGVKELEERLETLQAGYDKSIDRAFKSAGGEAVEQFLENEGADENLGGKRVQTALKKFVSELAGEVFDRSSDGSVEASEERMTVHLEELNKALKEDKVQLEREIKKAGDDSPEAANLKEVLAAMYAEHTAESVAKLAEKINASLRTARAESGVDKLDEQYQNLVASGALMKAVSGLQEGIVQSVRDMLPSFVSSRVSADYPEEGAAQEFSDNIAIGIAKMSVSEKKSDEMFVETLDHMSKVACAIQRMHFNLVDPSNFDLDDPSNAVPAAKELGAEGAASPSMIKDKKRLALYKEAFELAELTPKEGHEGSETRRDRFVHELENAPMGEWQKKFLDRELNTRPVARADAQRPRPWDFVPDNEADFFKPFNHQARFGKAIQVIFVPGSDTLATLFEQNPQQVQGMQQRLEELGGMFSEFENLCSPITSGGTHYVQRQAAIGMLKQMHQAAEEIRMNMPGFRRSFDVEGDSLHHTDLNRINTEIGRMLSYVQGRAEGRLVAMREQVGEERFAVVEHLIDARNELAELIGNDANRDIVVSNPKEGIFSGVGKMNVGDPLKNFDSFAIQYESALFNVEKPDAAVLQGHRDDFAAAAAWIKDIYEKAAEHDSDGFAGLADEEKARRMNAHEEFVKNASSAFAAGKAREEGDKPAAEESAAAAAEEPSAEEAETEAGAEEEKASAAEEPASAEESEVEAESEETPSTELPSEDEDERAAG